MTAAPPGPSLFSIFSGERDVDDRIRHEAFLLSLLGQAAILSVIVYFTSCVIRNAPEISRQLPKFAALPIVFLGHSGGGGGSGSGERCIERNRDSRQSAGERLDHYRRIRHHYSSASSRR
jgi:hypothetical protein